MNRFQKLVDDINQHC